MFRCSTFRYTSECGGHNNTYADCMFVLNEDEYHVMVVCRRYECARNESYQQRLVQSSTRDNYFNVGGSCQLTTLRR